MATIVSVNASKALWNDNKEEWQSENKILAYKLNVYYKKHSPPAGANPFPAGVAVELAKRHIEGLKIIEMDDAPEYDPKAIY
ncbi:MAG: hypothetical protein BWX72_00023 [Firmicutes bacterium ADurb.Bin080]|nr:MAG: hypothetical protein BWX72_00023 [Firmicutes bacterium ADurb.Bin080]